MARARTRRSWGIAEEIPLPTDPVKITSCRFEVAAFRPEDEPKSFEPELVFLGRSNVGKSSLINAMLGTSKLARTSSTPGRTQSVNFYRVNESFRFVDLPGYGYAKVPESVRKTFEAHPDSLAQPRHRMIAWPYGNIPSRGAAPSSMPPPACDIVYLSWGREYPGCTNQ